VQRALRLARYLPGHGWEPVFIIPRRARCHGRYDPSLLEEVAGARAFPVSDPMPLKEQEGFPARAIRRLWNWAVWPDGHVAWARNAAAQGIRLSGEEKFDAIFATGFPFSAFMAGGKIAGTVDLPLFLDYRDPWTGNPGMKQMPEMEDRLIRGASGVFCATPAQVSHVSSLFGHEKKFATFFYSYEPRPYVPPPGGRFRIGFGGNAYNDRTPFETFFRALLASGLDAEFVSHGNLGPGLGKTVRELGLAGRVRFLPFLGKEDYFRFLQSCHAVLVAHGIPRQTEAVVVGGRFLDALAVGRPVLYAGTPGVNWELVERNRAGRAVDREDEGGLGKALRELASWPPEPVSAPELEAGVVMQGFVRELEARMG